jgi:Clr5 domain
MALIFKHGFRLNASRVPNQQWNQHKELLCSLYREKPMSEVVKIMKDEYNILAT